MVILYHRASNNSSSSLHTLFVTPISLPLFKSWTDLEPWTMLGIIASLTSAVDDVVKRVTERSSSRNYSRKSPREAVFTRGYKNGAKNVRQSRVWGFLRKDLVGKIYSLLAALGPHHPRNRSQLGARFTEPEIPLRRCREGLPSYGEEARGRNFPRLRTYCSHAKRRRSSRNWPPPDVARRQ